MGWGAIDPDTLETSNILLEMNYGLLDPEDCLEEYPNRYFTDIMLCAGDPERFVGCGIGDSGAPVFCTLNFNPNLFVIVGLISLGSNQYGLGPDVLAKLSVFIEWIVFYADNPHMRPPRNLMIPSIYSIGLGPIRR